MDAGQFQFVASPNFNRDATSHRALSSVKPSTPISKRSMFICALAHGGVPGLDGMGDFGQFVALTVGLVKAETKRIGLVDVIQKILRRGGEHYLDIGLTGRIGIYRRADGSCDIAYPLGEEFCILVAEANRLGTNLQCPPGHPA